VLARLLLHQQHKTLALHLHDDGNALAGFGLRRLRTEQPRQ